MLYKIVLFCILFGILSTPGPRRRFRVLIYNGIIKTKHLRTQNLFCCQHSAATTPETPYAPSELETKRKIVENDTGIVPLWQPRFRRRRMGRLSAWDEKTSGSTPQIQIDAPLKLKTEINLERWSRDFIEYLSIYGLNQHIFCCHHPGNTDDKIYRHLITKTSNAYPYPPWGRRDQK